MASEPIPDPSDGWADEREQYSWDQHSYRSDAIVEIAHPRWHDPKVLRALIGLIFVVGVFVIAPVAAMFANAH